MRTSVHITVCSMLMWCAICSTSPDALADVYTGALEEGNGLTTYGSKWLGGTPKCKLEWLVTNEEPPPIGYPTFIWKYSYTLTVPQGAPSHMIVEASDAPGRVFTTANIKAVTGSSVQEIMLHESGSSGNPNLPADVHGIKFEGLAEATTITITFFTDRDPIWGDFYSKDGEQNSLHNDGLVAADPDPFINPPANGPLNDHLLVPDTIAEPATLSLLALGGLAILRRRRN